MLRARRCRRNDSLRSSLPTVRSYNCTKLVALDAPYGDQQVGVSVGVLAASALGEHPHFFPALLLRGVDIELNG